MPDVGNGRDEGSGGGTTPLSGPEAYIDDSGLPIVSWTELIEAGFDCRKTRCPSPATIIQSPAVKSSAAVLFANSLRDKVEWGAWLYLNPDGTIRVGSYIKGEPNMVWAMRASLAPPDAIGSIHTYWRGHKSPSGGDSVFTSSIHSYLVVASVSNLYILNTNGSALYAMPRR
jgi:hypothetical protein